MTHPQGSPSSGNVCRLRRALYGLNQAPRAWYATFSVALLEFGFTTYAYDPGLFLHHSSSRIGILLLYFDDMIITGDDASGISDLQAYLSQQLEMKSLGPIRYFLGLEVSDSPNGFFLSQANYASDLLARAGLTDCQVAFTQLAYDIQLTPHDGSLLDDPTFYCQLVGSLIYLTVIRPDIANAVHIVSQFMAALRTSHHSAVLHIFRYVNGTFMHGLHFSSHSSLTRSGYSADWAGDPIDRRSTTSLYFFLGDPLIFWRNKKQTLVSHLSAKSKYRAPADSTSELLWFRQLFTNFGAP
ncbi:uncharacterized mitochondrial protein AtMg00810-like [Andrographis paniculata]|uniref:uncharacterized mitochondrial protein AtMg00810-like n=1 Tax=Andrographis paniculata TaxID=175694 RepID=UPI0021E90D73|nr:uncharacterized mitochondrial protein AtMg00810-like [Andrographis paniculata]